MVTKFITGAIRIYASIQCDLVTSMLSRPPTNTAWDQILTLSEVQDILQCDACYNLHLLNNQSDYCMKKHTDQCIKRQFVYNRLWRRWINHALFFVLTCVIAHDSVDVIPVQSTYMKLDVVP